MCICSHSGDLVRPHQHRFGIPSSEGCFVLGSHFSHPSLLKVKKGRRLSCCRDEWPHFLHKWFFYHWALSPSFLHSPLCMALFARLYIQTLVQYYTLAYIWIHFLYFCFYKPFTFIGRIQRNGRACSAELCIVMPRDCPKTPFKWRVLNRRP